MTIRSNPSAERVRNRIDHPVIDSDGHLIEFLPLVREYVRDIAGAEVDERFSQQVDRMLAWKTLTVEQRRKTEQDLLKLYHRRLVEYGVSGYTFKQLMKDYQLNLVVILLMFSNSMDELDKSNERSRAVLDVMYQRLDAALVDWKTVKLLRVLPYMIPFLKLSAWFRSTFNR